MIRIEQPPAILLVSSPQTSKNETLPKTDLLGVRPYRRIVRKFEEVLNLPVNGSLKEERQIASVVNSIGSHFAFIEELNNRLTPGLVVAQNRPYQLKLMGHSVGEMACLVEAGVCDISTMAWILNEREKITENPFGSGLKLMVAAVGVDPDKMEEYLDHLRANFTGQAELFLANKNTPKHIVLSIRVLQGKAESIVEALPRSISAIVNPITNQPLFPRVRVSTLKAKNAFHSAAMLGEELIFKPTIAPRLNERYFREPPADVIYSPMLGKWVKFLEEVFDLTEHQLTYTVKFTVAMAEAKKIPNLKLIVTVDPIGTTPKMVQDNIGTEIPIVNIKDRATLNEAVDIGYEIVLKNAA